MKNCRYLLGYHIVCRDGLSAHILYMKHRRNNMGYTEQSVTHVNQYSLEMGIELNSVFASIRSLFGLFQLGHRQTCICILQITMDF